MTQKWTALVSFDGIEKNRVTGYSAEDAMQELIAEIVQNWREGDYDIDAAFIVEFGEMLQHIESPLNADLTEFTRHFGDSGWRIEVVRVADCDMSDTRDMFQTCECGGRLREHDLAAEIGMSALVCESCGAHVEFEDDCEIVDANTDF